VQTSCLMDCVSRTSRAVANDLCTGDREISRSPTSGTYPLVAAVNSGTRRSGSRTGSAARLRRPGSGRGSARRNKSVCRSTR
jgi:hypothetical protein